jgi:hypothetical protein
VATPAGQSPAVAGDRYTYDTLPSVSGISPAAGAAAGGAVVTVTGTGFVPGATVVFATTPATKVVVVSSTQLRATAPAGTGMVDVSVITAGGISPASPADSFSYQGAPTVSGVSPNSGPTAGGRSITITGTDFVGASRVLVAGSAATSVTVVSPTEVTAVTPAHAAGITDVRVTTAQGTSVVTTADRYTYAAPPAVTALGPAAGPVAGGTVVTVTGTGFVPGSTVAFGPVAATSVVWVSATRVRATAPAGVSGTVTVTVTTPGGTSAASPASMFTYQIAPTVTSVTPSSGPVGGGQTITITGTDLVGVTGVTIGGAAATSVVMVSATQLTVVTPAHAAGPVSVRVTTPGGTSPTSAATRYTYSG